MKKAKYYGLILPFFIIVTMFLIIPALSVVMNSFRLESGEASIANYTEIFTNAFYIQAFSNSLILSLQSAILGLIIASVVSYSIYQLDDRLGNIAVMITNMTSNFAGVPLAFAFMILLGNNGVFTLLLQQSGLAVFKEFTVYSQMGLLIIYVYFQIPLGILLMFPSFDRISAGYIEAAASMGASRAYFWHKIGVPMLMPAIASTGAILFANAMGAYATAYALTGGGYNLIPIRIGSLISGDLFLKPNLASALSVVLAITLFTMNIISRRYSRETE